MRKLLFGTGFGAQFSRFVIVGVSNFVITYAIYVSLLPYLSPTVAFAAVTLIGIVYTTALNIKVVFRSGMTVEKMVLTALYQLGYSLANLAVFRFFITVVLLPPMVTPLAVMCTVVPIHFLCSKALAKGRPLRAARRP